MMKCTAQILYAFFALIFSSNVIRAAEINLTMSHYLPPALGLHKDFLEPWARELERKTSGKVKVDIQTAGTALGKITKQWDQVVDGTVDVAFGLHGIPRGRFICTSVIELPFLTDSGAEANHVLWDIFPQYLAKEHKEVHVLALMAHDPGVLATREKKVVTPADVKGLRIRVPSPYVAEMLKDLGAVPVGMPPGQVYENLQTGNLDGVVLPWAGLKEFRITEVVTNAIEIDAYTTPFFFIMNRKKYASLPDDVRKVIDEISGDALVAKFAKWWMNWGEAGPGQIESRGGEVVRANPALKRQWKTAVAPTSSRLEQELAERCPAGKDFLLNVKARATAR